MIRKCIFCIFFRVMLRRVEVLIWYYVGNGLELRYEPVKDTNSIARCSHRDDSKVERNGGAITEQW